ncbi:MAG: DUF1194 domain-containing protein [Pseudomonadota bacterium]
MIFRGLGLWVLFFVAGATFTLQGAGPAKSQPQFCDLALVLAMDASSSVDPEEYKLQMDGIASALLDPEVQEAIMSLGGIYLAAFEWNGKHNQKVIFDWTFLKTNADLFSVANGLTKHQRNASNFPTAIGHALAYASGMLKRLPVDCARKVIDVSGDGPNNDGFSPKSAYLHFPFENVTVNGLVIKDLYNNPESFYRDPERYYRDNVIKGGGAFLVLAEGFGDFARAMKQKLLKEIVPGPIGQLQQAE